MSQMAPPIHLGVVGPHDPTGPEPKPPLNALCGIRLLPGTLYLWGTPDSLRLLCATLGASDYKLCPSCIRYMDAEFPAPLDT